MRKKICTQICLTILIIVLVSGIALAGEPRGYRTVPVGMNLFEVIYGKIEGNTSLDGSLVSPDMDVEIDGVILRYARYFDWNGRLSAFGLIIPYGEQDISLHGDRMSRSLGSDEGMGDPTFIIGSSIFGGPAMTLDEFAQWKPTTAMNWSVWTTAPLGSYDENQRVNLGSNRWTIKPELNYTKVMDKLWLEINASASWFSDNNDYQGDGELEQEILWIVEGHLSYDLSRKITMGIPTWVSLDLTGTFGGETEANGISQDDSRRDWMLGTTLNFKLHKNHSLRLFYFDTLENKSGGLDTKMYGIKWSYVFGGGFGY